LFPHAEAQAPLRSEPGCDWETGAVAHEERAAMARKARVERRVFMVGSWWVKTRCVARVKRLIAQ
jgi:hypothetical protein